MFKELDEINRRPKPFEFYTAADLWTDEYISKKMLEFHLNEAVDISSRNINFINKSVAWIIDHFRLNTDSTIIDFGCGPGLYITRYAEKGINATGIDFSKLSIAYAKKTAVHEGIKVNYINKNYLEYEPESTYDLITMIMCDFCALSPGQRKTLLDTFKKILMPDGSILLDVYSLAAYKNKEELATYEPNHLSNFWSPHDYYCFINTFKYDDEKVTLDKYTIIEKHRTRMVYNWL